MPDLAKTFKLQPLKMVKRTQQFVGKCKSYVSIISSNPLPTVETHWSNAVKVKINEMFCYAWGRKW